MGAIDLDAARAARREGKGEAPTVMLNGKTYELPVELPTDTVKFSALLSSDEPAEQVEGMQGLVRTLFDGRYDEFITDAPYLGDLEALIKGVLEEYGVGPGESVASPTS